MVHERTYRGPCSIVRAVSDKPSGRAFHIALTMNDNSDTSARASLAYGRWAGFTYWSRKLSRFIAARGRDGYPMRCLSAFQEAYREVASQHGCIFIDGQSYLHAIGRNGLLDDEQLFQDAIHPSLRGQIALAQTVLCGVQP
jgi:hypothetical protein